MSPPTPHLEYRALTSLDKSKSAVDPENIHSESQDFSMPGEGQFRSLVVTAMEFLNLPGKSVDRYADCCAHALVSRHKSTLKLRIQYETCGSRFCPNCAYRYRRDLSERIIKRIGIVKPKVWRFLTLTIKSTDEPLANQLDNLRNSFRRLRQTVLWLSTQLLGYAVIEITFNNKTQRWHPHLHVLTRGIYINQKKLAAQWAASSRGSMIVDVRMIKNGRHAVHYICKYLGKAPDIATSQEPVERMIEYIDALRNRKMVIGYGVSMLSESRDLPTEISTTDLQWQPLMSLKNLLTRADEGDAICRELLAQLKGAVAPTSQPLFFGNA